MWIAGIDYGSKMAGTSVFCKLDLADFQLVFSSSLPKKDADVFLKKEIEETNPLYLFIDAPLSLPLCYKKTIAHPDFFFRKADRELNAMSPLFLGGLTARAMKIKYESEKKGINCYEAYPALQAKRLGLNPLLYKKEKKHIPDILEKIQSSYPLFKIKQDLTTWHQVDALLALIAAYRFYKNEYFIFGDEEEGLIYV